MCSSHGGSDALVPVVDARLGVCGRGEGADLLPSPSSQRWPARQEAANRTRQRIEPEVFAETAGTARRARTGADPAAAVDQLSTRAGQGVVVQGQDHPDSETPRGGDQTEGKA